MSERRDEPLDEPLPELLHRLARGTPGAEPVVLESLEPPSRDDEAAGDALDFLFRRLQNRFREAVAEVKEAWGDPVFAGSVEEPAFPAWSSALMLAVWRRGDVAVYLALDHAEPEDPLTLTAGALEKGERAELELWHPALR